MASTTFRLRVWTRFLAPRADVWVLKTDPRRLVEEFLPYALFLSIDGGATVRGAREGLTGKTTGILLPPGLPWPIDLIRSEPERVYVDHSKNLLYSRFEHQHLFEETPDGCRYIDDVIFQPALPFRKLSAVLTERMFIHRHQVAARHLPVDVRTVGTSVLRVLIEEEREGGS
ncbi:MAG: hypothetical protein AAFV53_12450 [Myxococcota bacterium]